MGLLFQQEEGRLPLVHIQVRLPPALVVAGAMVAAKAGTALIHAAAFSSLPGIASVHSAQLPAFLLLQALLTREVFHGHPGGLSELAGRPDNATALLAGLPGEVASGLSKELSRHGLHSERVLFCDYF